MTCPIMAKKVKLLLDLGGSVIFSSLCRVEIYELLLLLHFLRAATSDL